jgi:hypothetical protein
MPQGLEDRLMPPVIGLIVGLGLAGTGGLALSGVITAEFLVTNALAFIISGATMVLSGVVGLTQKPPSLSSLTQQGSTITVKQSAAPRVVVYGRDVAGSYTYLATTGSEQRISAPGAYFRRATSVTPSRRSTSISTRWCSASAIRERDLEVQRLSLRRGKLGAAGEAAFPGLVADTAGLGASAWTSACRQDGCCSIHFKLKWDQTAWPNGVPEHPYEAARQEELLDPRTSTTAWSNNWALCVRDWMTDSLFGLKCPASRDQRHRCLTPPPISPMKRCRCRGRHRAALHLQRGLRRQQDARHRDPGAAHRRRRAAVLSPAGSGTSTAAPGARPRSRWATTTSAPGCSSPRAAAAAISSAASRATSSIPPTTGSQHLSRNGIGQLRRRRQRIVGAAERGRWPPPPPIWSTTP